MDEATDDLCLIDAGITSLHDVPVNACLLSINLHCNYISKIENLHSAHALCHLDLSSNRLTSMQGLSSLSKLKLLNLSCNSIDHVTGLEGLVSLISLNLSYNRVVNVDGFQELNSTASQLKILQLQGNQLSSVHHLCENLRNCCSLRSLVLYSESSNKNNPLCADASYREKTTHSLPHLCEIDGLDVSSLNSIENSCEHFQLDPDDERVQCFDLKSSAGNARARRADGTFFKRPHFLTSEAGNMGSSGATDSSAVNFSTTITRSNTANGTSSSEEHIFFSNQRQKEGTDGFHRRTLNLCSDGKNSFSERSDSLSNHENTGTGNSHGSPRSTVAVDSKIDTDENAISNVATVINESSAEHDYSKKKHVKQYELSAVMEKKQRDDLKDMYIQLMRDMEVERERRLKAEDKSKFMSKQLQLALHDHSTDKNMQELHKAVKHFKKAVANEKELRQHAQSEVDSLKAKLIEMQKYLDNREQLVQELVQTVDVCKKSIEVGKQEHFNREMELNQQVHELRSRADALVHEVELTRLESSHCKQQIGYLENMIAECEKTHKNNSFSLHSLKSQEVEDLISKAFAKAETAKIHDNCMAKEKYDALVKKYAELENEFRAALQMESKRFKQLQVAFQKNSLETAAGSAMLETICQQNKQSSATIAELTLLVREQKGRLFELARAKAEQTNDYRDRIEQLEMHVNEARQRMIQMEFLKEENTRLQAALQLQESVVFGLREERKVWNEKLAQQSAKLAQDRGNLESKIESLLTEIESARKQLGNLSDTVHIKTKVIEDQTETVKRLKEAVVERDEQLKDTRGELLQLQQELENQLAVEIAENKSLTDRLRLEQSRKEDLRAQLGDLQLQLSDEKRARCTLEENWQQKTDSISAIEKQVRDAQAAWKAKEHKLTEERDGALQKFAAAEAKLRQMDDAFRHQLDAHETSHCLQIAELTACKQAEIDAAINRTSEVEQEMRTLLNETESYRRTMEERVKKLTSVVGELHQDIRFTYNT